MGIGHGGKREGAGRKQAKEPKSVFRLTQNEIDLIQHFRESSKHIELENEMIVGHLKKYLTDAKKNLLRFVVH